VNKREKKLEKLTRDLKEVLKTEHEATAAVRLTLRTGLLEQFKATVQRRRKERRRSAGEKQR
jgi:hypothetical protein